MPEQTDILEAPVIEATPPPDNATPVKPILTGEHKQKLGDIILKMQQDKQSDDVIKGVVGRYMQLYGDSNNNKPPVPASSPFEMKYTDFGVNNLIPKAAPAPYIDSNNKVISPETHADKVNIATNELNNDFEKYADNSAKGIRKDNILQDAMLRNKANVDAQLTGQSVIQQPIHIDNPNVKMGIPQSELDEIKTNPENREPILNRTIKDLRENGNDKEANKIESNLFLYHSADIANPTNEKKISDIADKIKSGEYGYVNGRIVKYEGAIESIKSGYEKRTEAYDLGHEFLFNTADENIKKLNDVIKKQGDPLTPISVPKGMAGEVGNFIGAEGINTIKSTAPNLIPGVGTGVAMALSAEEAGMRGYADKMIEVYGSQRETLKKNHPDWSQDQIDKQAYDTANKSAKFSGFTDAALMAILTRSGGKTLSPGERMWSKEAIQAGKTIPKETMSVLKKATKGLGEYGLETIKTGLPLAGAAGSAQVLKNLRDQSLGIDKNWSADVAESMKGMLLLHAMFHTTAKIAGVTGEGIKELYQHLAKLPETDIMKLGNNLVHDRILSRYEADQVVKDVADYKGKLLQIPPHITDDKIKAKLVDKIDQHNTLTQQLKGGENGEGKLSDGFKNPIQEKLHNLEQDMDILQQHPEKQIKILSDIKDNIELKLSKMSEDAKEGKAINDPTEKIKLQDRLKEVNSSLKDATDKVNSPDYKAEKIIEPHLDKIPGMLQDMAKQEPEQFLKFIADQSQGISENGEAVSGGDTRYALKEMGIPDKLVDQAIELFPSPKIENNEEAINANAQTKKVETSEGAGKTTETVPSISVIRPEENRTPNIIELKNIQDNAVQEQSTGKMDVLTEAGDGKTMGSGNFQPGEPTGESTEPTGQAQSETTGTGEEGKIAIPPPGEPISDKAGEQDPEMTKMANAINDAHIEGKFGTEALDKVFTKLQDTDIKKLYDNVKARIEKGLIDIKKVRERLITTKQGSEQDQAILMYDLANLKGKENALQKEIIGEANVTRKTDLQKQLLEVQDEMMDNALANRAIGRTASSIFRLRQLWVNREMNIADMQEQYMASKGLKELSFEQVKEIQTAYNQIRESRAKLEAARMELDKALKENDNLKSENQKLKELKNKITNQKKSENASKAKENIAKSNERIQQSREELKKLRGGLNDFTRVVPKTAIAIGKIAAEKVYQGIVKFDELVKNVYEDVKDIFPEWTEKDVVNHLLAKFDKEGNLIEPSMTAENYLKSKELLNKSSKEIKDRVKAYEAAQKEVALKQYEWQKERRMDLLDNRPTKEKIIDNILRWQRFAVLSYPTTLLKLGAVVGHQLTLKPLKFVIQKFIHAITPKSITSKQSIWGNPEWSSLGKYYSGFIRNFALSNLKEHFNGVDTKEMLYGKPMMYDEWSSAKGLLDMPGRSHGYIKSFIKNPEFQYAHEQQMIYNISKMADIQKQIDDPKLSADQKAELHKEYDKYDVTNEDVMERLNKLSLEHGKWAILMNDNKFVDKFRGWTNQNGIIGALLKSEAPILKIPINYVGRAFATKYGLVQSLLGKGDVMPSVIKLAIKGTKGLTEEQANLLGRTLTLGTMGASFFTMGYLLRKKIQQNDDGSVDVAGIHISKNLTHSPEFESIFSGAETGNSFDKENIKKASTWIKDFVASDIDIAKKSPFTSMLQYGFIPNVATALLSKKDNDTKLNKVENAVFKKVSDMTIPGFIKQPAGWMDTKDPGIHPTGVPQKRKPDGNELERFWETLELGIPILRKNVPLSKKGGTGSEATPAESAPVESLPPEIH